jgi:hypothetical protein
VRLSQQASAKGDFNADGTPDIIFQNQTNGWAQVWYLGGTNGTTILNAANLTVQNSWRIVAVADFNQDSRPDVLWQEPTTGAAQLWFMGGALGNQIISAVTITPGNSWRIVAAADFNQDNRPDIVWQDPASGTSAIWFMGGTNGATLMGSAPLAGPNAWRIAAAGDFNNDGRTDIAWQDQGSGFVQLWFLGGTQGTTLVNAVNLVQTNSWRIVAAGDYNQDGRVDFVWQDPASGTSQVWFMGGAQGTQLLSAVGLGGPNTWRIAGPK